MAYASKQQSDVTFGYKPSFSTEGIFDYGLSDDKKAFTITFNGLGASVGNTKAPTPPPVDARAFSIVIPMAGGGPVSTVVTTTGFAMATEGANGTLVFTINGDARIFPVGPGFDGEILHSFDLEASGLSEMRISLQLLVERDSAFPDAAATLTINAIDTDLVLARGRSPS